MAAPSATLLRLLKVKRHIDNSKWASDESIAITTIIGQQCLSLGDALREVDTRGVIREDFVLVSADVVANYGLTCLEDHR